jgi:hypothetical protein
MPLIGPLLQLTLLGLLFSCGKPSAPPGPLPSDEAEQLAKRYAELRRLEQALSAEYAIARDPAPYLVVDLSSRRIELKARGRILRGFSILDSKIYGDGARRSVWTMTERRPIEEEERPQITPGAGEEAAAEAAKRALWGPSHMPADFDLICEEEDVIQIRALPVGPFSNPIMIWISLAYQRSADWYRRWRVPRDSRPRYCIQLWLAEYDSQLLFWSLPKRLSILTLTDPASP